MWGLSLDGWSRSGVAAWLNGLPCAGKFGPVTPDDFKNAARPKNEPFESAVAAVPVTLTLIRDIATRFPAVEALRFFGAVDHELVVAALAEGAAP
jgi:hypothetical protein